MYSWQVDGIAALLETDETKSHRRLYEAISESAPYAGGGTGH
jgi:hypothetical protein